MPGRKLQLGAALALALAAAPALGATAVDYIDPFIGTGNQGKDFPGACTPFSMVKVSPDTVVSGPTSYYYSDKTIQGFSFTHLGGADGGALGSFLVAATTGPLKTFGGYRGRPHSGYLSSFAKATEKASAGYYAVTLADYHIRAEATAAPHSGMLRFTFPKDQQSRIQVDLSHRIDGTALYQTLKVVGNHTIEGKIVCTSQGGGWRFGGDIHYTVYYYAQFSRPFTKYGAWSATLPAVWRNTKVGYGKQKNINQHSFIAACRHARIIPGCRQAAGQHIGFYTQFATKAGDAVMVKAGLSYVGIAGAKANLKAEIPGWNFDRVHQQARQRWVKALRRLTVHGGSARQKTIFYSALYRSLLYPQIFQDRNGDYRGGDGKVHHAHHFVNRTIFSGWDDYRSEYPLLTLIYPNVVNDQINSMVALAHDTGRHYYSRWEIMGNYENCMTCNPEVAVINDAYQKGIRKYNVARAYRYCVISEESHGNGKPGYKPDQISKTNDYGFDDWNVAQLAAALGKKKAAAKYQARSMAFKKLFNPKLPWTYHSGKGPGRRGWQGWFCGRNGKGKFDPWPGLLSPRFTVEATVYQAGWTAYNDVPGMIKLLGGRKMFVAKLNDFFSRAPDFTKWNPYMGKPNPYHIYGGQEPWWNPYNNPVNEPTELIPFLFNRAGAPWLTQKWLRQTENVYYTGPQGMPGDDDVGQMSAWYVLAASGITQGCPGSMRFEVFTPRFNKVTFRFDHQYAAGRRFTIVAPHKSPKDIYIQSATFNGKPLNRCWLSFAQISAGGTLKLTLGPRPNMRWGTD